MGKACYPMTKRGVAKPQQFGCVPQMPTAHDECTSHQTNFQDAYFDIEQTTLSPEEPWGIAPSRS